MRGCGSLESELVSRAKGGDSTAFSALVQTYILRAYRIAFVMVGDHHEAEDVVQDAFLMALQRLPQLREVSAFRGWLYQIVGNRARDHLRRKGRDQRVQTYLAQRLSQSDQGGLEATSPLWSVVASLSAPHRTVVLLHFAGGLSTDEVSLVVGRPVGTVRRWLSEAYRKLRATVTKEDLR